jgi:hypothetical protein
LVSSHETAFEDILYVKRWKMSWYECEMRVFISGWMTKFKILDFFKKSNFEPQIIKKLVFKFKYLTFNSN